MPLHLNEWFAPKPHPIFEYPALGYFHFEGDVWTANIPQGANNLELSLAGNESAPDKKLVAAASALLARFSEVKEEALAFLTSQEEAPNREDFICHGLELLREDCPNHFSLSSEILEAFGGSSSRMGRLCFSLVTIKLPQNLTPLLAFRDGDYDLRFCHGLSQKSVQIEV